MKISLLRIGINAILALLIGFIAAPIVGVSGLSIAVTLFVVGVGSQLLFKPSKESLGTLKMGLLTEVWVTDIKEELFFENEFLMLAEDHSSYIGNKTVHIPQSGSNPNVVKNRTELVADLKQRTDTEISYTIDNYTTDPFLVKDVDELNISYSKRASVMGQHMATMRDAIAENTLLSWATEGTAVIRTTGDTLALADYPEIKGSVAATGTRKQLSVRDFARASAIMDLQKVPKNGRYAVLPTALFYDLFTNAELIANRARLGQDEIKSGVVGDIHGFKIIYRGTVTTYSSVAGNVLIQPDATTGVKPTAATDCAGGLFFSRFAVSQALGEIKMYYNPGEARSYGDILSAEVNHGASFCRANNWGRVGIAQAVGA